VHFLAITRAHVFVYENEGLKVANALWHTGCCRCAEPSCNCSLNLKTALVHQGNVYCKVHLPKAKHTTVADDVMTSHAKAAQATKQQSKEDKGAVGAIHKDMRAGDGKEVHTGTHKEKPAASERAASSDYGSEPAAASYEEPAAQESGGYEEPPAPAQEEYGEQQYE